MEKSIMKVGNKRKTPSKTGLHHSLPALHLLGESTSVQTGAATFTSVSIQFNPCLCTCQCTATYR